MTTSLKIKQAIVTQGRKKNWLAQELGISRPNLDKKSSDNYWTAIEIVRLQNLGLIG